MSMRDELEAFPHVQRAWDHCKPAETSATHLRVHLESECEGFGFGLRELDSTLGELLANWPPEALDEVLRALFGDEDAWRKAESELLGLNFFLRRGVLESIGWPPGGSSTTPPFEGRARVAQVPICFDVKSAEGSSFDLVVRTLRTELKAWDPSGNQRLSVRMRGTYSRVALGRHRRGMQQDFRSFLRTQSPTGVPFETKIVAGSTTIEVHVEDEDDGVTSNSHVGSPTARAAAVGETMLTHIKEKAVQARKNGAPGFFLLYVRPASRGASDFTPTVFKDLAAGVLEKAPATANTRLWLGSIYLDFSAFSPQVLAFANPQACWPAGLSARVFLREAFGIPDAAVARTAFRLWTERGAPHGSPLTDWLAAEDELLGP